MPTVRNQRCALAMLDVLGFKRHLNGPNRQQAFTDFVEVVSNVNRVFHAAPAGDAYNILRHPGERTYLFSDTLLYTQAIEGDMTAGHAVVGAATGRHASHRTDATSAVPATGGRFLRVGRDDAEAAVLHSPAG
jgi:hypothetical protein